MTPQERTQVAERRRSAIRANAIAMGWDTPAEDEMQELFSTANLPNAKHQQKTKTHRSKKSHPKNKKP